MYAGCNLIKTQSLHVARFVNIYYYKQVAERVLAEEVIGTNRKQCPERKQVLIKSQVKAVTSFLCVSLVAQS